MHNNRPAQYLVKTRERVCWTTTVHKGSGSSHRRRVERWSKWKTHHRAWTALDAFAVADALRESNSLRETAVFYMGKRYRKQGGGQ